MRQLVLMTLLFSSLLAKVYMGKIEPIQSYNIFSQTSGEIIFIDTDKEHSVVNGTLLKIDASIEKIQQDAYLKQQKNYKRQMKIKYNEYKKVKNMTAINQVDKDALRISILDLEYKLSDLELKLSELKNTLKHKAITVENLYLRQFFVNKHDYVTVGQKVAELSDISKAKIVIYVHKDDMHSLRTKKIHINAEPTQAKIIKIARTPDDTYVSSYKIELQLKSDKFGEIVKIEFK